MKIADILSEQTHGNSKIYDKCWKGYKKVPGKKRGEAGSCVKIKEQDSDDFEYPAGQLEKVVKKLNRVGGFARRHPDPADQLAVARSVADWLRRGMDFERATVLGIADYNKKHGVSEQKPGKKKSKNRSASSMTGSDSFASFR